MTIELRLTDVDPPTADPPRTIYHDISSLPDPVIQGITIRYFNYDDVSLYFKITGSGTGYTFTPATLGLLASAANAYKNLDNFASRARPTVAQLPNGEMGETIILTLTAYTDSGYTNLKWTFNRTVQVIWINSADAAFTIDELDNFDDGTVQGWANSIIKTVDDGYLTLAVATDYVLSAQYSLKSVFMYDTTGHAGYIIIGEYAQALYKTFTLPNRTNIYAVFDIRVTSSGTSGNKIGIEYLQFKANDIATLIKLGFLNSYTDQIPRNRWIRVVIPLGSYKNASTELRIILDAYSNTYYAGANVAVCTIWIDDFKIISK